MREEYSEERPVEDTPEARDEAGERYIEQAGVICLRECAEGSQVLLIQGRRNGKWGIPKGGIEVGETSSQAAAREAFEEAGISGHCEELPLASFRYRKAGKTTPCRVAVHWMHIESMTENFPENEARNPRWVDCRIAADLVGDEGLGEILLSMTENQTMRHVRRSSRRVESALPDPRRSTAQAEANEV